MVKAMMTRAIRNSAAGVTLVSGIALVAMLAGGPQFVASASAPLLAPFSGGADQLSDAPALDISAADILPSLPQEAADVREEETASLNPGIIAPQPLLAPLDNDLTAGLEAPLPAGDGPELDIAAADSFETARLGALEEAPEIIDPGTIPDMAPPPKASEPRQPNVQAQRQEVVSAPAAAPDPEAHRPEKIATQAKPPAAHPASRQEPLAKPASQQAPAKAEARKPEAPYLSAYEAAQTSSSGDAPILDLGDGSVKGDAIQVAHAGDPASQIADTEDPRIVRNPGVKASEIADTSAAPAVSSLSGWLSGIDISIEAIGYHEEINFDADAPNNPGNNVYRLHDSRDVIELRPEFRFTMADFWLEASPRLTWSQTKTVIFGRRSSTSDFDADVIYGAAGYATGPFSIKAGRYVNLWGPSVFLSPSNPFHDRSTQISPFTELEARDYVEAAYAIPDTNWTAGLIYNFNRGNQAGHDDPIVIAKADWYGATTAFTGMVQGSDDWYGAGGYGQWTPNDSTVLYADGLIRYGERRIPDANYFGLVPSDDKGWGVRALVGGSYTFEEGTTVSLEYLHNSEGYSSDEADLAFALNSYGIHSPYATSLERRSVGNLADIGFFDLGRHYLMGRISKDELLEDVNVSMLYAHNLEDQSGRLVGNVDWLVNDNVTLFANGLAFHGDEDSEFGRFSDTQLTLGVRWRPELGLF